MDSNALDPLLRSDTSQLGHDGLPNIYRGNSNSSTPNIQNATTVRPGPPPQFLTAQDSYQTRYPSQSPHSQFGGSSEHNGGHADDGAQEVHDATHEVGPDGQKRPRACEACRGLKVRCELDPNNPEGACKRCAKARRNCVVTVPSRKRQKKTDSRVAELEKKIDALTATLHATKSNSHSGDHGTGTETDRPSFSSSHSYEQVTNGGFGSAFDQPRLAARPTLPDWESPLSKTTDTETRKQPLPPMVIAGQKRKHHEKDSPASSTATPSSVAAKSSAVQAMLYDTSKPATAPRANPAHDYTDVIDRGIVSADLATHLFKRYNTVMAPLMPAVVFSPEITMADVRKSKPTLFLAILCAGSGSNFPDLQRVLTKEVMQIYADRVICSGEKTLELIQALLVSTIWYWPPEHFEELKFYQLIHLAAVMAIDINLSRKVKSSKATAMVGMWRDHQWRRTPYPDPESAEGRRAWLACYFLCCNAAMGLRRPHLIRWSNYIEDCVSFLETSPEAAASDRVLCQWVRSQRIAEEVGISFSMDDAFATVTISDPKTQYALKGFERDLEHWSDQVPKEVQSPLLKIAENVLNLYMHEVAMHVDHNVHDYNPPFTEDQMKNGNVVGDINAPLTALHIAALSKCLTSIDGIFTGFLSLEVDIVRALPVLHFVRIAYAVVVLIKLYFAAAIPGSELGKVIDKDNMKVEFYLDGLLDQVRTTAADDKSRPASKFLMVLIMLKTWFHRQKTGKGATVPTNRDKNTQSEPTTNPVQSSSTTDGKQAQVPQAAHLQNQQQSYSPANTPLQLLSEVATSGNGGQVPRPESSASFHDSAANSAQAQWSADGGQAQPYPYGSQVGAGLNIGNYNIDPNLAMLPPLEYDPIFGDGFEQAMGMTLGDGEFGQYFSDDLFGVMMNSGGAVGGGIPPANF